MALGVEVLVEGIFHCPRWIVRDDGERGLGGNGLSEVIGVIGGVGHHHLGGESFDQRPGLWRVAFLTRR